MVLTENLHIGLPLLVGLGVAALEAFFVYEDENMSSGREFLKDIWHGALFALVGVFISTNVPWLLAQGILPSFVNSILFVDENGISIVVCILITLFMLFKMVAVHAMIRGRGFREKFWHKLLVAILVGFAPYYILMIKPSLEPFMTRLPAWML